MKHELDAKKARMMQAQLELFMSLTEGTGKSLMAQAEGIGAMKRVRADVQKGSGSASEEEEASTSRRSSKVRKQIEGMGLSSKSGK